MHFACSGVDARVSAEKEYSERKAELKEAKEVAQLREKAEREVVAPAASSTTQTQATKATEAKKSAKPASKKAPAAAKAIGMSGRGREVIRKAEWECRRTRARCWLASYLSPRIFARLAG